MAAEAYNETGNTPKAWELLNSVRKRSGATEITTRNYKSLLKTNELMKNSISSMIATIPANSVLPSIGNAASNWLSKDSVNSTLYVGAY